MTAVVPNLSGAAARQRKVDCDGVGLGSGAIKHDAID
jgi:hypothetical protein